MTARQVEFPKTEVLQRLALSDSGFVFDPLSGASYTVNTTGIALLRRLQHYDGDITRLVAGLRTEFEVDAAVAEQDTVEFAGVLRSYFK
ncbi:MAG: PqqD family protein [Rhodocyclaceae bacterium]|jgi:hypothetical protein|nr:PqqD family protein [Rhodocyclaceae bacterium]MBK6908947.1 PqqD family protein [Rhodocyclaceae bacterium]